MSGAVRVGILKEAREAFDAHNLSAEVAYSIYRRYCAGSPPARVPGMDTVIRLAVRIAHGKTVEQAAAQEYLYRWRLAIMAPDQCIGSSRRNPCVSIFGTPHLIGM
ncbi:hypothetical protein [Bradyrhizobium sp. HKCCYLS20291]|uniref:hypothetical protein n=1 Tax=Bradyrhizobium sp. HKCCYLS20291 TaxID=3420766 RepID=UPI003EBE498D